MISTTAGRLWLSHGLPAKYRDPAVRLDAGKVSELLDRIARESPDDYPKAVRHLLDVGRTVAYRTGGYSFGLKALRKPPSAVAAEQHLRAALAGVYADPRLTPEQKREKVVETIAGVADGYEKKVFEDAKAENNPIALQVLSGSRGKPSTLQTLIGGDLLYQDSQGRPIPVPVLSSYAQGLTPAEFFASAYGTRTGVIGTKLCLSADTSVLMADGTERKICDVKVGEMVTGADALGRTFPVRVRAVYNNGDRPVRRYRFRVGSLRSRTVELTATEDHQVLASAVCRKGWRGRHPLGKYRLGDADRLVRAGFGFNARLCRGQIETGGTPEPRALLAGLMLGDGCMSPSTKGLYQFSCADPCLTAEVNEYLVPFNLELRKHGEGPGHGLAQRARQKQSRQDHLPNKPFGSGMVNQTKAWLKAALGEKLAHEKMLPADVWLWDEQSVCDLLAGLYSTDGCVWARANGVTVQLRLTSRVMLEQVQRLLELKLGVWTSGVSLNREAGKEFSKNRLYSLEFSQQECVSRFASKVRLVGKKREQLEQAVDRYRSDHPKAEMTTYLLDSADCGVAPTFDLEVEHPDHLFVLANGLIVSNSTANSGYLGKQLVGASHRLVTGRLDHDEEAHGPDPNRHRGLPVAADDAGNVGSLLARDTAGYPRNTVLTAKILRDLKDRGHGRILVRSPLTSNSADGTVYGRDAGVRERGGLPAAGDQIGIAAAQAIGEIVSQSSLGSKHCLAAGTLVRMADGSAKPIQDVRVGDRVLGADRNGRAFPVSVVNTYDNGVRDCVRTEFAVAMTKERIELVCTLDHKLLGTKYQWALPSQLKENGVFPLGQKCTKMTYRMVTAVENEFGVVDEPLDLLLGLLLGDGCYRQSVNGVYLSCFDPSMVEDIRPQLETLNLKVTLCAGQRGYYRIGLIKDTIRQEEGTGRTLPGDRNPVKVYLKQRGMWDLYAHDKQLPDGFRKWTNRSVFRLLAGLLATDGSVYDQVDREGACRTFINYGSTSLRMLEQVKELLHVRLGIHCGPIKTNDYGGRKRPMYSLNIHRHADVRRFAAAVVEHTPGVKKKKLEAFLAKEAFDGRDYSRFYKKSQTSVGSVPTYDIEVDHPDHLFVLANGLIVSNSGGVSKGGAQGPTGFKLLNLLAQAPKGSPFWAAHAGEDGAVRAVEPSPAGGWIVKVGASEHHVPPTAELRVKVGDRVEAGDLLSSGIPDPNEFVRHRGVGEGRRLFTEEFRKAVGLKATERRNLELLGRGLINHVKMTDEHEGWLPDDVVPYDVVERSWRPREGTVARRPAEAVGRYLESPALHYTVGTHIKPSVARELEHFGVESVDTHHQPPPFQPHFVRSMDSLSHDPDWMVQHMGSNLQKNTLKAVHRGAVSDENSTSFVPSLARGKDFGKTGPVQSYRPSEVLKPGPLA